MPFKISKKLTEKGENDEKPLFGRRIDHRIDFPWTFVYWKFGHPNF